MAYVDPEKFDEGTTDVVYVAGEPGEAKDIEHALTTSGIDYTLVPTTYIRPSTASLLLELPGVGFMVLADDAERARRLLQNQRFLSGLVFEGEEW